jgi:hypothetical protein
MRSSLPAPIPSEGSVVLCRSHRWLVEKVEPAEQPQVFGSHLNTLRWNCVTSTDPGLFQSPLRAGIDVKPYQLELLRKALRMPTRPSKNATARLSEAS